MPTHRSENLSSNSSPTASSDSTMLPCHRQPIESPQAAMTASPSAEPSMSAMLRPATTADGAMGMERKRSVTPLAASLETESMVLSGPNAMVMANIPGMRNSR